MSQHFQKQAHRPYFMNSAEFEHIFANQVGEVLILPSFLALSDPLVSGCGNPPKRSSWSNA
jgi:hypothetical protein